MAESELCRQVAAWIMRWFGAVNFVTLILLVGLAWLDQHDLEHGLIKPGDRLVDSKVLIALPGATTVQLGSIAVIMAKFVFNADG